MPLNNRIPTRAPHRLILILDLGQLNLISIIRPDPMKALQIIFLVIRVIL